MGKVQVAGGGKADGLVFRNGQGFLLVQARYHSGNIARHDGLGFFPQQAQHDGGVRSVAVPGGGQGAVAFAADALYFRQMGGGAQLFQKAVRRPHGAYRVGGGGAYPDAEKLKNAVVVHVRFFP